MSIAIKHKVFKDFLRVEFKGKRTPGEELEEGIAAWKQVADMARNTNLNRIMVVSRVKGRLPAESAFNITQSLDIIGWQVDFIIAGVVPDKIAFTNLSIFETIMQNLGYEGKIFEQEGDAKKWLLSI
ncbi:MAG: hypothetical protein HKN53_04725 [Maribacter sp.]|nr:hypothetical protein [Maribacter sp.]